MTATPTDNKRGAAPAREQRRDEATTPNPSAQPNYRRIAERRWRDAEWICGRGCYAVVAKCRALTITLWPTLEKAEKTKRFIDDTTCGGRCWGCHEVVDLAQGESEVRHG